MQKYPAPKHHIQNVWHSTLKLLQIQRGKENITHNEEKTQLIETNP